MNKLSLLCGGVLLAVALVVCACGQESKSKSDVEGNDLTAELFAYFGGGGNGEAIRFAVSRDGYNYRALNNNEPIMDSQEVSSAGGLRDPHIMRAEDGKTFYMVATDMKAALGWDSNRAMVLMKSTDLVDWTTQVVNIQQKFPGNEDLKRVWAPQTIYDREAGKYLIYWSMKHGDEGRDIIYYAYANLEFTDLESEPKQLFFPRDGKSCIDGDIIDKDGVYYLFYKTEGHGDGIKLAVSRSLTSGEWEEKEGYKQQTRESVEGSGIFKLNNSDTYIMMYDVYRKKEFHFTKSDDLENFTPIDNEISMDFKPRHGTIMPITDAELHNLIKRWGTPEGFAEVN
ncbi:glycoside hydrolase family 43 protein [Bacteroidales bacterium OttesenSCG-928-J19]|nr:glycoside hydrolase family 43 protein [Bacteroidales bacterium OttesenSCG-928-J19]